MKTFIITIFTLILLTSVAFAATYTFTSNSAQEAIITAARTDYNNTNGTSFTNAQYIRFMLRDALKGWRIKYESEDQETMREAYRDADQSTKDQIKALLGR